MAEAYFDFLRQTHDFLEPKISRLDSAGTAGWHIGSDPDPRTLSTLRSNGIGSYEHSARQITISDFFDFDYILAMDRSNLEALQKIQKKAIQQNSALKQSGRKLGEVRLFGEGRGEDEEVSDPYYGGEGDFEECFMQVGKFAVGFITEVFNLPDGWWAEDKNKSSHPVA
jgi:low molecular weight phosphotyrosine protein phosphatase